MVVVHSLLWDTFLQGKKKGRISKWAKNVLHGWQTFFQFCSNFTFYVIFRKLKKKCPNFTEDTRRPWNWGKAEKHGLCSRHPVRLTSCIFQRSVTGIISRTNFCSFDFGTLTMIILQGGVFSTWRTLTGISLPSLPH